MSSRCGGSLFIKRSNEQRLDFESNLWIRVELLFEFKLVWLKESLEQRGSHVKLCNAIC
ncbi:unnamed protein product [Cylicocyclus nassatus]|uniref:Uncharacterized protein n=1 Tax=Cylicocyclus nassatus TaxID=53992 RepID=A0AA36H5C7_CYLNA|nr:unnamed protein product [Cylicocyclus nassatus]